MKQFVIFLIAALGTTQALADSPRFINGDGSALTNLCIAAVDSDATFKALAAEHGFDSLEESDLVCNGLSLSRFKLRYGESDTVSTVMSFSKGDLSPSTELCFAAVTGAEDYESLKASYNSRTNREVSLVTCNGMPLDRFVRRYGAEAFAAN